MTVILFPEQQDSKQPDARFSVSQYLWQLPFGAVGKVSNAYFKRGYPGTDEESIAAIIEDCRDDYFISLSDTTRLFAKRLDRCPKCKGTGFIAEDPELACDHKPAQ